MDSQLLKDLGLDFAVIAATKGEVAAQKIPEILDALNNERNSKETRLAIANQLKIWGSMVPAATSTKAFKANLTQFFDTVYLLGSAADDNDGDSYNGKQKWAHYMVDGIQTTCSLDTTQAFAAHAAPEAYACLEKFLGIEVTLEDESPFVKEQASTERCAMLSSLFRILPYQGNTLISNGVSTISRYLLGSYPDRLKTAAKSAMSQMAQVNKEGMKHSGRAVMELVATGNYDDLLFTFLSMPEMYTLTPSSVHDNIPMLLGKNWMHVVSLVNNVAANHAEVLVPYTEDIIRKISEVPSMGAITISILKEISKKAPSKIYPHIPLIVAEGKGISGASYSICGCIANAAAADAPPNAGDSMLPFMMEVLNNCEAAYKASCLAELSNMKETISSRDALTPYMDQIVALKGSNSVIVGALEDFYAGRSLESLGNRVDAIEMKITELNNKVAESCHSFEDVIAYVDANIADMKDFLGDVVKKLPTPKRLEVVGTLRKTLILHFECVHTGYEFPIISKEWSKWLKMGFALAKAGKAVIDIGMGNPLALVATGVECVQGIYEAYKTNDDDEFNSYITNPFLTSTEQDQLLEKLRDQGFFDKMAYDNQAPGWYLLNPEEDGVAPAGEKGSVTKVSSKKGYSGVGDIVSGTVNVLLEAAGMDSVAEVKGLAESAHELVSELAERPEAVAVGAAVGTAAVAGGAAVVVAVSSKSDSVSNQETKTQEMTPMSSPLHTGKPGARAAAMRSQMAESGTLNTSAADAKLQSANNVVALENKVSELEKQVSILNKQMREVQEAIANQPAAGCNCVIS